MPVFVTIDQLAFVSAAVYNIPAAIFCGQDGTIFMIYKESLDDPVLRLGNIIENFKSILKKRPPSLPVMEGRARRLLTDQMDVFLKGEWVKIIGFRNRIVHEYFGVDLKIIWQILQKDLPSFRDSLMAIRTTIVD